MDPLLRLSATEQARRIRGGSLSSRALVEAYIGAIERANPRINALVADRFAEARAEADAADRRLAEHGSDGNGEPLGPFHGVPCTIKESFALAGMPNSAGLPARRDVRARRDAVTVARMRRAGFIPLGVTNISELCMWMESHNRVYGRTNNPYDHRHIAGGSSGGEGAIVGAGASPIGLGSDIGGSIRMPAFFCGAFGHKPTGGLVPCSGQYPIPSGDALRYDTTGPIARHAEDLMPLLRIVAGPHDRDAPGDRGPLDTPPIDTPPIDTRPIDTQCRSMPLGDPAAVTIRGLRVLNVPDNGVTPVSDELRDAQQRVARQLAAQGAVVRDVRLPGLRRSLEIWSAMLGEASETSFSELLGNGREVAVGRELLRWALRRSPHTLPALGLALLERLPLAKGRRARRMVEAGRALQGQVEALIGQDGVMLYPSYASVAPRHMQPLATPFRWVYTAVINVLELPSTQVPLGLNRAGLPLGVQVVGCRGRDHLTIAVAEALQRAFGGWVVPAWWDAA